MGGALFCHILFFCRTCVCLDISLWNQLATLTPELYHHGRALPHFSLSYSSPACAPRYLTVWAETISRSRHHKCQL